MDDSTGAPSSSVPRRLQLLLKLLVTAVACFLLVRKVPWGSVAPLLADIDWLFLGLAMLCFCLVAVFQGIRWWYVLRIPGLAVHKYLYFVLIGYYLNLILPSALLGDALRAAMFIRRYGHTHENVAILFFVRILGLVIAGLIGLAGAIAYFPELQDKLPATITIPPLAPITVALVVLAALWLGRNQLRRVFAMRWTGALLGYFRDLRLLSGAALLTLAIQLFSNLSSYFIFRGLGIQVSIAQLVLFLYIIQIVTLLPISFGGVGVREYLSVLLFTDLAGLPPEGVFSSNLLGYACSIALAALAGLWFVARNAQSHWHAARSNT